MISWRREKKSRQHKIAQFHRRWAPETQRRLLTHRYVTCWCRLIKSKKEINLVNFHWNYFFHSFTGARANSEWSIFANIAELQCSACRRITVTFLLGKGKINIKMYKMLIFSHFFVRIREREQVFTRELQSLKWSHWRKRRRLNVKQRKGGLNKSFGFLLRHSANVHKKTMFAP